MKVPDEAEADEHHLPRNQPFVRFGKNKVKKALTNLFLAVFFIVYFLPGLLYDSIKEREALNQ